MIPALQYQAIARGSALKQVVCEECGFVYFYVVKRKAKGHGKSHLMLFNASAAERAEAEATAGLSASLNRAVEFVPCPTCGRYQNNMVQKARRLHKRWLDIVGLTVTIMVGTLGSLFAFANYKNAAKGWNFAPSPLFEICVGLTFALGLAMLAAKRYFSKRFDPNNQDVEERRRLGHSRSLTRADLEKISEEAKQRNVQTGPVWLSGLLWIAGDSES